MNKIRYSIVYNYTRTGELRYDGTAIIYIRAYLNGKHRHFGTNIYVAPNQWDERNKRVIKHENAYQYNQRIRNQLSEIETYEFELLQTGCNINLKQLGDYRSEKVVQTFTVFYEEQLEQSVLAKDSFTDQRQTLIKLREFRPTIYFHELSYRLIHNFDSFLHHKKGLHTNTIAKHHKNLKKYINLAIKYDLVDINDNPYKKFKVKRQPTSRIFLTKQELKQFEQIQVSTDKSHLELIKSIFLFSCYTGLRISDVKRVSKEHLTVSDSGVTLHIVAKKTGKSWQYNLRSFFPNEQSEISKPEAIIRKYLIKHQELFGDSIRYANYPLFTELSEQYINRQLKVLAKMMDIRGIVKKCISMHVGRHTFGTLMANKVRPHILQQLMQHSKIKETMIYVHLSKAIIEDALDEIKW